MTPTSTKAMLRRVVTTMCALALAACGGGSDSDTTTGTTSSTPTSVVTSTPAAVASPDPLLFDSSNYSTSQDAGTVTLTVLREGGATAAVSVDYTTVDGTAIGGTDYTAATGTLQWAANDTTSRTITVPVSGVNPFAGNKSFTVELTNPSDTAQIASPDTAVVTISGAAAPGPGSLQLSTAAYSVAQSSRQLTVTVTRTTGAIGATSVNYATNSGTAISGTDYSGASGTLTWVSGDATSKTILIPISAAVAFSGTKAFAIVLSNPGSGAVLGTPATATATISGASTASMGTVHLSSATYAVNQGTGSLTVSVGRSGGSNGDITVNYATANGTAVAGSDFSTASGTLKWASGDTSSKSVAVAISSAVPFSGSKNFTLSISSPTNGSTISSPSKATVTISGANSPAIGSLEFGASSYSVSQDAGSVTLSVVRVDGATGAVSVNYATASGSAQSGSDYSGAQGTLDWADGDTASKTFQVPVSNATGFSGTRSFTVSLSSPGGGAAVSAPGSATVAITGTAAAATGGPSAPQGLLMTGQGANSISLSWNSANAGNYPVASYKIYRNGSSYATSTSTKYTDGGASNATSGAYNSAASYYTYAVAAVDTQGNEGPKTTQIMFNVYRNGVYSWKGDFSYGAGPNYWDTSGGPESGNYDIAINAWGAYSGFQPFAGNVVPLWDLELNAFKYITLDLKPTNNSQAWRLSMISRLPPGDVYPWAAVNITDYGPTPVAGKWATYKIPLSALSIGSTSFQGSISGNTLTVTSVGSGVGVDAGGFISGNGVKAGTYIVGHNANGGPGTYTISPSQYVSSTSMTEQRTSLYKFDIVDESGASNNTYFIDNVSMTN